LAYTETALYVDSVAYTAVAAWAATHAYTVGQIVRQLAAPSAGNERCFICLVGGTSQASEPSWTLTRGAATNETTVHWMECTGLPALCADKTNTNKWAASAGAIALGWIIQNVAGDHYFICTTAGSGGTGSEPAWNTTAGATTADGSVTWTCTGATSSFTTNLAAAHARLTTPLNGAANWLPNAGMNVYVGDDHGESNSGGTNYSPASGCSIICFDHTVALPPGSANLKTTALITASGGNFTFLSNTGFVQAYVYGIRFSNGTGANVYISNGSTTRNVLEQCTFGITGTSGSDFYFGDTGNSGTMITLKDCTFSIANFTVGEGFYFYGSPTRIENGIFTVTLGTAGLPLLTSPNANSTVVMEGCDFSGVPSSAFLIGTQGSNGPGGTWTFKDCVIPAGMVISSGTGGYPSFSNVTIDLNRVDSGATGYRNERYRYEGKMTTATGVMRTGGASDGATPISHQITTNANTNNIQRIFNSAPFAIWNSVIGANRNVTVYGIVNDSRVPNNDEAWFDVEYLGSATSPKGSYVRGGKANVLASGSVLTADTSAWDGAATARANSHAYNVGDVIKTASNAGRVFFCTVAGTSASSEPGGYATAVDGGLITDGTATFRAGCRFAQTLVLSSPQPQQAGYIYAYPKIGRPSMTYYIDPVIQLS
jgi:hypothetical protein